MRHILVVLCLVSFLGVSALAQDLAKAPVEIDEKVPALVTVEWVHPADGGNIKVVFWEGGKFIMTKTFKPAKEGARVPIVEPIRGIMMEKWVIELEKCVAATDWTKVQPEYKAPADLPRPGGGHSADYTISKTIDGKTYTSKVYDCKFNRDNIPPQLYMMATISVILQQVRMQ